MWNDMVVKVERAKDPRERRLHVESIPFSMCAFGSGLTDDCTKAIYSLLVSSHILALILLAHLTTRLNPLLVNPAY